MATDREFVHYHFLVEVFAEREIENPVHHFRDLAFVDGSDTVLCDANGTALGKISLLGSEKVNDLKNLALRMRGAKLESEFFGVDRTGEEIED